MSSINYSLSLVILLLSNYIFLDSNAQVSISNFPRSNQIYQRDASDSATVQLNGFINTAGAKSAVIIIKRDDFIEKTISYSPKNTGLSSFSINIRLKAGAFNYTIESSIDGKIPLFKASDILVGDVFVFYGQSNSIGLGTEVDKYQPPLQDKMVRMLYVDMQNDYGIWQKIDFLSAFKVGIFPIEVLKKYRQFSSYPVGLIQAAHSGKDLLELGRRNPENPFDFRTKYGELLTKLKLSGNQNQIRYFIFRQGENEAIDVNQTDDYPNRFTNLMNQLKIDIPSITHFFNFQLNIMGSGFTSNPKLGELRDFQRQTENVYPIIRSISSVGIDEFDGVHYFTEGYSKAARRVMGIFAKEVLGQRLSNNVYSPNVKKIFFNEQKNRIYLKFNDGMDMVYPKDSSFLSTDYQRIISSMKDEILIDGQSSIVKSGGANKNYIWLDIDSKSNYKTITYHKNTAKIAYTGVHVKNAAGECALTFANKGIEKGLKIPELKVKLEDGLVKIRWPESTGAKQYQLERRAEDGTIMMVLTTQLNFIDSTASVEVVYTYRVMALNDQSESEYSKSVSTYIDCKDVLNLSGGSQLFNKNPLIQKVEKQIINQLQQKVVKAKKSVILLPGFETNHSGSFLVSIGGCK